MTVRAETQIDLARVDDGSPGTPGQNGATFTPSVDVAGDISWTNDGGLPNPPTQNIMGPPGTSGPSITDIKTQYYLSSSDSVAPSQSDPDWSNTPQAFVSGQYYWTREYTTYSDSTNSISTPVYNQGLTLANEYALTASDQADAAEQAAENAINQLSIIEDVVGVLGWISTHGTYQLTTDEEVDANKWYFTYDAVEDTYNVVVDPSGDPSSQGWYELASVDEAVQDYVTAHLALTNDGLYLQNDADSEYKVLIATDGLSIIGENGATLAKYGTEAVIGDEAGFHIKLDGTEIGFYQADQKVAYINGNKLYITQSIVLQQMDIGTSANEGGLGQWSWKVHEVNGQNNLYLKWLG